jgi:hypothetical protein
MNTQPTGVKHDQEKPPLALLPGAALAEVAKVLGFGAAKYAPHNWRKGIVHSRLLSATLRHLAALADGERLDPETNLPHAAHAACELLFLLQFHAEGRDDLDDLPRPASQTLPARKHPVDISGIHNSLNNTAPGISAVWHQGDF